MEGWVSPAAEVIAYRAESSNKAGKATGAAHPFVFHVVRVRRTLDPLAAGAG